ncbi:MAG: hypothetical protein E7201_06845 [Selenomonas ruminantium]|uniref:Uncharacterized protein n=1 Tax=Selenomonas ruminantium TaxID=971 RepID=A0A927WU89_SELRU|nr:hypothetical protein [Selenomonas ruminantium]
MEQEPLAHIKIKTEGPLAEIFIDGRKVPRVTAFKVEMNAMEKRVAQVTLRVQCNLDLETGIVPVLPEPWCWYYKPIHENFCDPREQNEKGNFGQNDSLTTDTCQRKDILEKDNLR